jgi:hypothetical protein
MRLVDILKYYGLAALCVVGPIFFGLGCMSYVDQYLVPAQLVIALPYTSANAGDDATMPANNAGNESRSSQVGAAPAAAPAANVPRVKADARQDTQALTFWTVGLQYRGRIGYAVASAFIYLISAAVFIFGLGVVKMRYHWPGVIAVAVVFAGIAAYCATSNLIPPGRILVVEKLLKAADGFFPYVGAHQISGDTGSLAASIVELNTFISFWSIGALLSALFVLSIRARGKELDAVPLRDRLTLLRVALGLGSTFLVIGVLAQKDLMDWPLSLIAKEQAAGLKLLADALTLQVGAQGTIGLVAAFGPAITAWSLDVAEHRRTAPVVAAKEVKADKLAAVGSQVDDALVFAPFATIASLFAVLAPLLASPFVDALKSILSAFAKATS